MRIQPFISANSRRARLGMIAAISVFLLAGCSGGSSSGGAASWNAPTGGGGGGGNSAPVITSVAPTAAVVGQAYSYQANASDADGDPITWSLLTAPSGMTVNTTGLVSWTPTSGQVGSHAVSLNATDGTANVQQNWSITVSSGSSGGGLPASLSLTDMGGLPNGMLVLSDMVEFDGKLYIAASQAPLTSPFGAGIYTYGDGNNQITAAFYDSGSQGFLRCKVFNNKLYVPDGDPNGYAPGKVYIWSPGNSTPLATNVTDAVHNFDVVEYNGNLYVSGSNLSGQSTLNRFNSATSTWDAASAGANTRLKYMGVLDNEIWSSKTAAANSADFVKVNSGMTQSGFVFSTGGGNLIPTIEMIDSKLYMTAWGSSIGVNNLIVSTGGAIATINGITGLMWDVIKHTDGNYYAVAWDGTNDMIFGSTDGLNFTQLYGAAGSKFAQPTSNQDGRPSIASYNGHLYVGSSTNGHLYRLD